MFNGAISWLAVMLAIVITFFASPIVYLATLPFVREFTQKHYGYDLVVFADYFWMLVVACTVFFTARASLSTLLITGGLALAARLFG